MRPALGQSLRVTAILGAQLAIALQAPGIERAGRDGRLHRAARLGFVDAIGEPAATCVFGDLRKYVVEGSADLDELLQRAGWVTAGS